jgi:hypothetical protein
MSRSSAVRTPPPGSSVGFPELPLFLLPPARPHEGSVPRTTILARATASLRTVETERQHSIVAAPSSQSTRLDKKLKPMAKIGKVRELAIAIPARKNGA